LRPADAATPAVTLVGDAPEATNWRSWGPVISVKGPTATGVSGTVSASEGTGSGSVRMDVGSEGER